METSTKQRKTKHFGWILHFLCFTNLRRVSKSNFQKLRLIFRWKASPGQVITLIYSLNSTTWTLMYRFILKRKSITYNSCIPKLGRGLKNVCLKIADRGKGTTLLEWTSRYSAVNICEILILERLNGNKLLTCKTSLILVCRYSLWNNSNLSLALA